MIVRPPRWGGRRYILHNMVCPVCPGKDKYTNSGQFYRHWCPLHKPKKAEENQRLTQTVEALVRENKQLKEQASKTIPNNRNELTGFIHRGRQEVTMWLEALQVAEDRMQASQRQTEDLRSDSTGEEVRSLLVVYFL